MSELNHFSDYDYDYDNDSDVSRLPRDEPR
jgi:hypothetical protein